jgi:hypothetical protein
LRFPVLFSSITLKVKLDWMRYKIYIPVNLARRCARNPKGVGMIGHSMTPEELKKLPHFDRLRRGYFDKIPTNLGLMGFTLCVHLFSVQNSTVAFTAFGVFFIAGLLIKEKFIENDDIELEEIAKKEKQNASKKGQKKLKGQKTC